MSIDELIGAADGARRRARADYSSFLVGCALETGDGRLFTGCNIENATLGLTLCAERVAIFKAISEGASDFSRLCVVTAAAQLTPPCGACRQIIWEFCGEIPIVMANPQGQRREMTSRQLLPEPFDGSHLQ